MATYFSIIQIIVASALIGLILVQARSGGLGGIFGSDSAVYRSRRGVERTLFNATVGLAIVFFLMSILMIFVS